MAARDRQRRLAACFRDLTDATLQAIAEATPVDRSQLLRISGIGAVKADRFGEDVLRIIAERIAPGQ